MSAYNCNFDDIEEKYIKYIKDIEPYLVSFKYRSRIFDDTDTDTDLSEYIKNVCGIRFFDNLPFVYRSPTDEPYRHRIKTKSDFQLCELIQNCAKINNSTDYNIIRKCVYNASFLSCENKENIYEMLKKRKAIEEKAAEEKAAAEKAAEEKAVAEKAAEDTRLKNIIIIIFVVIILIIIGVFIYIYFFSKKPVIDNNYFENDDDDDDEDD